MKVLNQHKAGLITVLITGIVVLTAYNLHLSQHDSFISETFYELEPEQDPAQKEELAKLQEQLDQQAKPETNKAFNETDNSKHFAQAYKPIAPPQEYENSKLTQTEALTETEQASDNTNSPSNETDVDAEELSSFNSVNNILKARTPKKRVSSASNGNNSSKNIAMNTTSNRNSSMHYSLVNRTHEFLPTPIYLCEASGKIIVNITVNTAGDVTDTYINSASTSKNECLIDSALEYAKKARFNSDASKPTQIGSITFYFEGKP